MSDPFQIQSQNAEENKSAEPHPVSNLPSIGVHPQEKAVMSKIEEFATRTTGSEIPWSKATQIGTYLLLLFTVFVMFYRSDFFSLTIALVAVAFIIKDPQNAMSYRYLCIMMAVGVVLDLVWMFMFITHWLSEHPEGGMKKWSALMSIVNLLLKLVLSLVYWKNTIELS